MMKQKLNFRTNDMMGDFLPLTPALSLGERENYSHSLGERQPDNSRTVIKIFQDEHWLFPLPKGEGQGEGERDCTTAKTNQIQA